MVAVIDIDAVADVPADSCIGVRPAFCMKEDAVVRKSDSVIEGKSVYTLELDDG